MFIGLEGFGTARAYHSKQQPKCSSIIGKLRVKRRNFVRTIDEMYAKNRVLSLDKFPE